jgi:vacuolar protein sorting-associated protein 52
VILYNVASQKGQKFTLEQAFKSVNKSLMDGVVHEIVFTAEFFNLRSEGAIEIFGPIFRPSVQLFLEHLKHAINNTYDLYALLLILAVNDKNRKILTERGCSALDHYFNSVDMLLWPKFEELFEFHLRPLQSCPLSNFKRIEKSATTKVLVDRFVDMVVAVYRLYVHFPNNTLMLEKRLSSLRRTFLELVLKGRNEFER